MNGGDRKDDSGDKHGETGGRRGENPREDEVMMNSLINLARTSVDERMRTTPDSAALARLTRTVAGQQVRGAWAVKGKGNWISPWTISFAVAAVLVIVIGGVARLPLRPQSEGTLSYVQEREPAAATATPSEAPTSRLRFSDGTTISAPDKAAVRVEDVRRNKPRIRVAGTGARVRVVHRPDTRWTFMAGPFEVLVTGTAFDLGWDAARQTLSLELHEGSVILHGPYLRDGSLAVRAGQRVSVSLASKGVTVSDVGAASAAPAPTVAAPPTAPTTATAPAEEPALAPPPTPAPAPATTPAPAPTLRREGGASWGELVRKGQFDRVIAEARSRPAHACEARCSAEDLRALGDAARYANRPALAGDAFRALRRRFAGTGEGRAAAYLLGRTCEADGKWAEAEHWYATYLGESPAGEFAVEAASGKTRVAAHRAPSDGRASHR
ncbi:MAG TPA: tetratricopeptide repeat protein [Polyangia bacterium]|nr:tetratricopeptide repeat protein [Polyangia bacterium]